MMESQSSHKRWGCLLPVLLLGIFPLLIFLGEISNIFKFIKTILSADFLKTVFSAGFLITTDTKTIIIKFIYSVFILGGHFFLLAAFLLLSIGLLSLFLLPVRNTDDWWGVFKYMLLYFIRWKGPLVWVKDGKLVNEPEEKIASRPGIVLVDLNSAVVIGEKRVLGPGFGYKKRGEKLRGAVDLRRQSFSRNGIQSNTRDGIKIQTIISANFTLSEAPELFFVTSLRSKQTNIQLIVFENNHTESGEVKIIKGFLDVLSDADQRFIHDSIQLLNKEPFDQSITHQTVLSRPGAASLPFSFDAHRVVAAVNSRFKNVKEKGGEFKDWNGTPAYIATEIFRDQLIHEKFDDLYLPEDPEPFPLKDFKKKFAKQVQCQGLITVRYVERRDNAELALDQVWDEQELLFYPPLVLQGGTVLRERGIKVIKAGFSELKPLNDEVKEQMLLTWQANWLREERETQSNNALKAMRIRNRARVQAQRDMVYTLSQIFQTAPHSREALAVRIFQALEAAATDPATRRLLPKEALAMLGNMRKWLLQEPDNGKEST